jgi:hypothetical protein
MALIPEFQPKETAVLAGLGKGGLALEEGLPALNVVAVGLLRSGANGAHRTKAWLAAFLVVPVRNCLRSGASALMRWPWSRLDASDPIHHAFRKGSAFWRTRPDEAAGPTKGACPRLFVACER